jgi:hypothetical protein
MPARRNTLSINSSRINNSDVGQAFSLTLMECKSWQVCNLPYESKNMSNILSLFPATYEASRERFRNNLPVVQSMWSKAKLLQHKLSGDEDLTIDWIYSDAADTHQKVFILTTGEHGVEGYVGSAMMQLFIEKYMPKLDPRTTGILLVHAINPWGMKHHRRGNRDNIDLNRTFHATTMHHLTQPVSIPSMTKSPCLPQPKRHN